MKLTRPTALFAALLLGACAAQGSGATIAPADQVVGTADSSADAPEVAADADAVVARTPDGTAADGTAPGDGAAADSAPSDVAADSAPGDGAAKLPATKGLQLEPLALPAFAHVVDSSGAAVSDQDLLGHYTVLWFYPAAGTSG